VPKGGVNRLYCREKIRREGVREFKDRTQSKGGGGAGLKIGIKRTIEIDRNKSTPVGGGMQPRWGGGGLKDRANSATGGGAGYPLARRTDPRGVTLPGRSV